ncbi:MAG: hypothetical protein HUU29_02500 [Planctomycetaceae bacterium]|nr:hypothetical protein [Planctomycetaceae bacterium]
MSYEIKNDPFAEVFGQSGACKVDVDAGEQKSQLSEADKLALVSMSSKKRQKPAQSQGYPGPIFKPDAYFGAKARAAVMLASGMRLTAIATKLSLDRNTLANWMREDEGFALMCGEEIAKMRDEIRTSATGAYMGALEMLQDLAEREIRPADRIKACSAILQYTSPMVNAERINSAVGNVPPKA